MASDSKSRDERSQGNEFALPVVPYHIRVKPDSYVGLNVTYYSSPSLNANYHHFEQLEAMANCYQFPPLAVDKSYVSELRALEWDTWSVLFRLYASFCVEETAHGLPMIPVSWIAEMTPLRHAYIILWQNRHRFGFDPSDSKNRILRDGKEYVVVDRKLFGRVFEEVFEKVTGHDAASGRRCGCRRLVDRGCAQEDDAANTARAFGLASTDWIPRPKLPQIKRHYHAQAIPTTSVGRARFGEIVPYVENAVSRAVPVEPWDGAQSRDIWEGELLECASADSESFSACTASRSRPSCVEIHLPTENTASANCQRRQKTPRRTMASKYTYLRSEAYEVIEGCRAYIRERIFYIGPDGAIYVATRRCENGSYWLGRTKKVSDGYDRAASRSGPPPTNSSLPTRENTASANYQRRQKTATPTKAMAATDERVPGPVGEREQDAFEARRKEVSDHVRKNGLPDRSMLGFRVMAVDEEQDGFPIFRVLKRNQGGFRREYDTSDKIDVGGKQYIVVSESGYEKCVKAIQEAVSRRKKSLDGDGDAASSSSAPAKGDERYQFTMKSGDRISIGTVVKRSRDFKDFIKHVGGRDDLQRAIKLGELKHVGRGDWSGLFALYHKDLGWDREDAECAFHWIESGLFKRFEPLPKFVMEALEDDAVMVMHGYRWGSEFELYNEKVVGMSRKLSKDEWEESDVEEWHRWAGVDLGGALIVNEGFARKARRKCSSLWLEKCITTRDGPVVGMNVFDDFGRRIGFVKDTSDLDAMRREVRCLRDKCSKLGGALKEVRHEAVERDTEIDALQRWKATVLVQQGRIESQAKLLSKFNECTDMLALEADNAKQALQAGQERIEAQGKQIDDLKDRVAALEQETASAKHALEAAQKQMAEVLQRLSGDDEDEQKTSARKRQRTGAGPFEDQPADGGAGTAPGANGDGEGGVTAVCV